jgi:kynurenine 3-monooxygenase
MRAAIVGGGLCGNLLALSLALRGFCVSVFEKRAHPASAALDGGRSINLALAARGIAALERFGAFGAVEPLLLPMRGRMVHEPDTAPRLIPYGASGECIYSVSRAALNRALFELAQQHRNVTFHFECECRGVDPHSGKPIVCTDGRETALTADVVFATDGAGSAVRRSLAARGLIQTDETMLEHGYKELDIAARSSKAGPAFALEPTALHIWPRGQFMLIALPNLDASFTATLFLARRGEPSFDSLGPADIESFFANEFNDALPLIDGLAKQFTRNAVGELGTVRCNQWHSGSCLLVGDAAHAIVPFHGQGMNAAFEDVAVLDGLLAESGAGAADWPAIFAEFQRRRIDNTNAIADMAIENYEEMRDSVRNPKFLLQRQLALELERRFPERFASRYSMVMFRPEIPYAQAYARGNRQKAILRELTDDTLRLAEVDFARAATLIAALPPLDQSSPAPRASH